MCTLITPAETDQDLDGTLTPPQSPELSPEDTLTSETLMNINATTASNLSSISALRASQPTFGTMSRCGKLGHAHIYTQTHTYTHIYLYIYIHRAPSFSLSLSYHCEFQHSEWGSFMLKGSQSDLCVFGCMCVLQPAAVLSSLELTDSRITNPTPLKPGSDHSSSKNPD